MRRLYEFPGGIHPDGHKAESNDRYIREAPLVERYVVPLRQHIGQPARPLVKPGDPVLGGQRIGAAEGAVSTAVHAPTSGRVMAVEERPIAHPSGLTDLCIVIEADGDDRMGDAQPLDWENLPPAELRRHLRDLGLAGLGGAVFPSHIKLDPGAGGRLPTLILNGAECEPWITCDDRLMRERAAEILRGGEIMARLTGAREVLVGIEDNKPEAIAAMEAAVRETGLTAEVVAVPTRYPGGGGKQLTQTLTGMETPSGGRSTDLGVQVFNVGTAYSLYRAVTLGEPLIRRVVTLTGHFDQPHNVEARIGTPLADLLPLAGPRPDTTGHIIGGPLMGFELHDTTAPLVKSINCVIAKSRALFPPPPVPLPCIRCGQCARACPAELQPFELYWYARARDFGKAQAYHLFDCIECGCCSYVCPSHIPLVDYYRFAKSEIWAREKEKNAADAARERHEFRAFRQEREKREKTEKLAQKAATRLETGAVAPDDPEAARKKAILQAAIDRANKARAEVQPQNVDNLPAGVQREIAEIDARRAAAQATPAAPAPEAPHPADEKAPPP